MNLLRSWRPLAWFWAAILLIAGSACLVVQFAQPARIAMRPRAAPPPPSPRIASLPASRADPAPPLAQTSATIPAPDPALQAPDPDDPDRMLPRIGPDGQRPAILYAAAFDPAERHPRVALVIDGAGLNRDLTQEALRVLPSAIDLAFSAYALPAATAEEAHDARAQGRECLVSIPMEPAGFPAQEEGDKSLLVGAEPAQNLRNLDSALANVAGCVGATGGSDGLEGARYAESRQDFDDLLATIRGHGLLYLAANPAEGANPAPAGNPPPRRVDIIVDRGETPDMPADAVTIDRNLARLADLAAAHGSAIGLAGPPTPVLLDRVSVWAQGLAARGLVLAPLSAIKPPAAPMPDPTPP